MSTTRTALSSFHAPPGNSDLVRSLICVSASPAISIARSSASQSRSSASIADRPRSTNDATLAHMSRMSSSRFSSVRLTTKSRPGVCPHRGGAAHQATRHRPADRGVPGGRPAPEPGRTELPTRTPPRIQVAARTLLTPSDRPEDRLGPGAVTRYHVFDFRAPPFNELPKRLEHDLGHGDRLCPRDQRMNGWSPRRESNP
jgi:hypothetical protein